MQPAPVRKHARDLEQYLKDQRTFQTSILMRRDDGSIREAEISMDRKGSPRSVGYVHLSLHSFPKPDPHKLLWDSSRQSASLSDYTCCPGCCPDGITAAFEKAAKILSNFQPMVDSIVTKSSKPGQELYKLSWAAWCELFNAGVTSLPKDPNGFRKDLLKTLGLEADIKVKGDTASKAAKKAKAWSKSVESAVSSAVEYELFSAITRNLTDDDAKVRYADWLEEQNDHRAKFAREFVSVGSSLHTNSHLPDYSNAPHAWSNMLGLPLFDGIIKYGLVDVKDHVLQLARPILAIKTAICDENTIPIGASKLGGRPDLPEDVEWPVCAESMRDEYPAGVDAKLGFLGQIALKDLALTQVGHWFPKDDGLLSIFVYQSDGYQPGAAARDTGDTIILYTPAAKVLQRRQPPDDLQQYNEIFPACQLTMSEAWDLPAWCEDEWPDQYAGVMTSMIDAYAASRPKLARDESADQLFKRLAKLRAKCNQSQHHLLGYSIHNRTNEPSPGPEWLHLLSLSSDPKLGWNWCDGEHLSIFVHQDDIGNYAFKRVFGYAS